MPPTQVIHSLRLCSIDKLVQVCYYVLSTWEHMGTHDSTQEAGDGKAKTAQ